MAANALITVRMTNTLAYAQMGTQENSAKVKIKKKLTKYKKVDK